MEIEKAKTHARRLEAFLKSQGVKLPYSACLEAVAHVEGVANWLTLEAQAHKQPIAVSVVVEHLSGTPAKNFFELPFMHPQSDYPLITTVLVADSLEEEKRSRTFHELRHINEELVELLAKDARGELDEDEEELLDSAEEENDELVLDWGDEYEGEGLYVGDLRGIKHVQDGVWQLNDGRKLELYASGKVVVPLQKQKDKRKTKRKA
jgi:hypothetical protein